MLGLYDKIFEVWHTPKNIKRHLAIVDDDGFQEYKDFRHEILQITSCNGGGDYIIDLSGAQFGHHQTVTPLQTYHADCNGGLPIPITSRQEFGIWKNIFGTEPPKYDEKGHCKYHLYWAVNQEASKCLLSSTKDWMAANQMNVKGLLRLKPEAYEISKKSLLEKIESDVQTVVVSMGKHYTQEQERCRSLGIPYAEIQHFKFGQ